jgi:hypothetical protein
MKEDDYTFVGELAHVSYYFLSLFLSARNEVAQIIGERRKNKIMFSRKHMNI